jgi:AcrR family transcriptional regulator
MGKREDILEATLDLVVDDGLASFSFSRLFERANVGAGTVYHYFSGKDALLEALYTAIAQRMDEGVVRTWSTEMTVRQQFDVLVRGLAEYTLAHPKDLALLEACKRARAIPVELKDRITPGLEAALVLLARGQAEGLLRPLDPHLALTMITGLLLSVVAVVEVRKFPWGPEELDQVLESCWRAVATDRGLQAER